jgi:hypothetical protein
MFVYGVDDLDLIPRQALLITISVMALKAI